MARFPRTEPEVVALVQEVITGLTNNPTIYPAPPVAPADLTTLLNDYITAKNTAVAAAAAAEAATANKDEALASLEDACKSELRYAENTVNYDDAKLKLLGWGGKKSPTPLAAPGQTRLLEATRQGEGWIYLDWKAPVDGGKPAVYEIRRRERPAGAWAVVATAVETEATLVDQPRGIELEYCAVAMNKTGEGEVSNTVMAVL